MQEVPLTPTLIAIKRFGLLGALWLVLTGAQTGAVWFGLPVVAAATWVSLRLMPPGPGGVRLGALAAMFPGFLLRSLLGGIDVATRVVRPSMPIRPGWRALPTCLPGEGARAALGGDLSLLPGTLAAGDRDGVMLVHCLDLGQDIEGAFRAEESRIAGALGPAARRAGS